MSLTNDFKSEESIQTEKNRNEESSINDKPSENKDEPKWTDISSELVARVTDVYDKSNMHFQEELNEEVVTEIEKDIGESVQVKTNCQIFFFYIHTF